MMRQRSPIPPKLPQRILSWFLRSDLAEEVLGDLEEKFYDTAERKNSFKAKLNYWYQVLNYVRPFAIKKSKSKYSNQIAMYKHYFKISWRTLQRQKMFSTIKIGGLSIGIAACILIGLFIRDEQSFDRHQMDGDRIFRMVNDYSGPQDQGKWTLIGAPIRKILYDNFPEIEKVARIHHLVSDFQFRPADSKRNVFEQKFIYSDPELLEILELPMVYGDRSHALSEPNSIVLTKSKAEKYFPNENPVGKQIILNDGDRTLTIAGVIEDFSPHSHLKYDFIISLADFEFWPGEQTNWCCSNYDFYVKLRPGVDKVELEEKLLYVRDNFVVPELIAKGSVDVEEVKKYRSYYLQPVSDIYLNPQNVGDDLSEHGSIEIIWVLGIVAVAILFLAVINFVNLSTAKSGRRAKEVGVRKVIGSHRRNLILQHLSESGLFSLLSILLGLLVAWICLPFFNHLTQKSITFPWSTWWLYPTLIGSIVMLGLLSGFYPSLVLSSIKPIDAIKGKLNWGRRGSKLRSSLVVFQFAISIVLIFSSIIIHRQVQYFLNKELGFDKEMVITIQSADTMGDKQEVFKNQLLGLSDVENVTVSSFLPISGTLVNNSTFYKEGRKKLDMGAEARSWRVDEDYIATLGIDLIEGRFLSSSIAGDKDAIVINRKMADMMGLQNPIGQVLESDHQRDARIIGVIENFHFGSLAIEIGPLCMTLTSRGSNVIIKTKSENVGETLAAIEGLWAGLMPNQAIRYDFLNDRFARTWTNVFLNRIKLIVSLFAGLAIFIACLGLFALSAFVVEQRSKEISIRKVLGAGFGAIMGMLTLNFVKLVVFALIIAIPVGWYLAELFLEDFAYRIDISWSVFVLSGLLVLVITLLSIGRESVRAALANPVDRLRSE